MFQYLWIPSILLPPRSANIAGDEEENKVGTVRVSRPRVDQRVRRVQEPHQEVSQDKSQWKTNYWSSHSEHLGLGKGIIFLPFSVLTELYFQQYDIVPATPLVTSEVLREDLDQWQDVKQGMSAALQEMRVEDLTPKLKNPLDTKNKLKERREKAKRNQQAVIQEETSIDVSREDSGTRL